ncbi:MAG: IMP dehydrogenase [Dehalococcoidales bacterium]|nr:IMP dehydrogenase [Dehalococcoidales bacterium]
MAKYFEDVSRTFSEYLLLPNLTTEECTVNNVDLSAPITKYHLDTPPPIKLNIPVVSAAMQSVSGYSLATELARSGGMSFIYCSQTIDQQAEIIKQVKSYKAGFVISDSNLTPDATLDDIIKLTGRTGHSTIMITHDGSPNGKLLGMITSKDYRVSRDPMDKKVSELMTPFSRLIRGKVNMSLTESNDLIWENKIDCLPVTDDRDNLVHLVFRKDYVQHKSNPYELLDSNKSLMVGAAVNTHDYKERIPALVDAGADILCIDSSDGYSEWQKNVLDFVRKEYGNEVKIGAGNVVDKEGFLYLANAGADFVKIGIGGGSICITREQKGIGRGQASAVIDINQVRNDYLKQTGNYVPLCSDGGIAHDYHITLALAMGADFVMMGRYFARFEESPTQRTMVDGQYVKEYWGEGTNRAKNWTRYDLTNGSDVFTFEEGASSYVPYAGNMKDNLDVTLAKIKSTMCNCGSLTIGELQAKARLTLVSSTSIVEGGLHDIIPQEN